MFVAATRSTAFEPACGHEQGAPSSSIAARRAAIVSASRGRPYIALRGRSDFQRVFRRGHRRVAGGVTVITAAGVDGPARVGLVAGKKVGGAVRRNRAKRRLREALAQITLNDGADYIVIASPEVVTAPFRQLAEWVRTASGVGEGET